MMHVVMIWIELEQDGSTLHSVGDGNLIVHLYLKDVLLMRSLTQIFMVTLWCWIFTQWNTTDQTSILQSCLNQGWMILAVPPNTGKQADGNGLSTQLIDYRVWSSVHLPWLSPWLAMHQSMTKPPCYLTEWPDTYVLFCFTFSLWSSAHTLSPGFLPSLQVTHRPTFYLCRSYAIPTSATCTHQRNCLQLLTYMVSTTHCKLS